MTNSNKFRVTIVPQETEIRFADFKHEAPWLWSVSDVETGNILESGWNIFLLTAIWDSYLTKIKLTRRRRMLVKSRKRVAKKIGAMR
jgi:hypothetical protein